MKMKNKIKLAAGILLGLALIAVAVVLILKKPASEEKKPESDPFADAPVATATPFPTEIVHEDAKTIRLTLPTLAQVDEWNRRKFNEALYQDGHKYRLEISYAQFVGYEDLIDDILEKGETDIASLGFYSTTNGNAQGELIKAGLLLDLDKLLSTERGKVLYDAFPKNLWETCRYNGKLYAIPQVQYPYNDIIVVFNKDYISAEAIEQWDGTLDGIYEIIKGVKWNDEEAARLQYQLYSWDDFGPLIGCDLEFGLVFDYETMSIENPLESEKYIHYMETLDRMRRAGYIEEYTAYLKDAEFNNPKYLERVTKKLEEGKFLVAVDFGPADKNYQKANMVVKTVPSYITTHFSGSIGIAKNAKDVDAAVDFLSLLYSEPKYANILLYGEEGVDYTAADNVAVMKDGAFADPAVRTALNLFINTYLPQEEYFRNGRKSDIFAYYDKAQRSPFLGFFPNTDKLNQCAFIQNDFWQKAAYPGKSTLEELVAEYRGKMKQVTEIDIELGRENVDRAAEYLESVRSQWEEFRK